MGGVKVCISHPRTNSWVFTQYIAKPPTVSYTVRMFVKISYALTECENKDCDSFELLSFVTNTEDPLEMIDSGNYRHNKIFPENEIPRNERRDEHSSNTTLYIDLMSAESGLYLAFESDERMCVTTARVLVYINACPSVEAGLARYPSTPSPLTGTVSALGECAANAHHTEGSQPHSLVCNSLGEWSGEQTHCECNQGHYRDGNNCRGI